MCLVLIYMASQSGLIGLVSYKSFENSIGFMLFYPALPYVKNPAADPTFETFFTKQWTDNYMISLHNFLATTFQHMRKCIVSTLHMQSC